MSLYGWQNRVDVLKGAAFLSSRAQIKQSLVERQSLSGALCANPALMTKAINGSPPAISMSATVWPFWRGHHGHHVFETLSNFLS